MSKQKWFNGNERLREIFAADPELAAKVEKIRKEIEEDERVYAMTLSMIRRAAGLTQVAHAESLKTSQTAVARTEQRPTCCYLLCIRIWLPPARKLALLLNSPTGVLSKCHWKR